MNTGLGSSPPSSVRVLPFLISKVPAVDLYTPGVRVVPPSSDGMVAAFVLPAASLYAAVRSVCAVTAAELV